MGNGSWDKIIRKYVAKKAEKIIDYEKEGGGTKIVKIN